MRGTPEELLGLLEAEQSAAYAGGSTSGLMAHEVPGVIAEWLEAHDREQLGDTIHDLHLRAGRLRPEQPCPVCGKVEPDLPAEAPRSAVKLVPVELDEVARLMVVGHYRDIPRAARERSTPVVEWIEARLAEQLEHVAELVCSCTPEFRGFHGKHHADCPSVKILREVTR